MTRPTAPAGRGALALLRVRRWQLRASLALLVALVVAIAAWYSGQQREQIEREALVQSGLYARVLEGHVARVVGATANALRALAANPLVADLAHTDDIGRLLAQQLPGQPHLRSLALLDAGGRVLASTTAADVGRRIDLDRLGRPEGSPLRERLGPLQRVRELGELAGAGSPPAVAAALPMLRGLESVGGTRWLVALINVDHFTTQHALITSGQPVRALTLGLDGVLIDSTGETAAAAGTDLKTLAPFTRFLPRQEHGSYIDAGSDGQRVVGSFRTTRLWPLLVIAEQPLAAVQAEWRGRAATAWGVALAIVALLAGLGAVAEFGLRREARARLQLDLLHAEVSRAEELWKLALEGAGHGVWDMDLAQGRASLSAPLMALLGHPAQPAEWTMADWRAQVHPDDVEPALAAARRHLKGELPVLEVELRMRNARAGWQWVLARGTVSGQTGEDGRAVRLVGTLSDVDARKTAEAALRESQAILDKVGRIAGVGGWTLDLQTQVTHWTDQTALIHDRPAGYQPVSLDEALGYCAPGAADTLKRAVQLAIEGGEGFDLELPLVTAGGRPIWVRALGKTEFAHGKAQRMVGAFQDITARVQAEQELRQARSREVMIGARIQQSLLVDTPDQRLPGVWLSTLSQASQGIDGDFVELVSLGTRGVDIIVGDVMGKGVGAALMGAATKMQFSRCFAELLARPATGDALPSPAEVMAAVHRAMTPRLQELDAFVTLSYLRLDTQAGVLTWVGCGHEEPLLLGADGISRTLQNQHPPLGVLSDVVFEQNALPLARGDALFLCSDGAADALLPDGSRLGRERVTALLAGLLRALHTPAAALHALRREIDATGARLTDDLTLALAMLPGDTLQASRRELSRGLDDLGHVRGLVDDRARKLGLDEVDAGLFALACVEAYTNAVRHTQGRPALAPIELVVRLDDDALTVDIITLGDPFELPVEIAETNFDEFPEGGFGLSIMRQASDGVGHSGAMGVNTARLVRRRA